METVAEFKTRVAQMSNEEVQKLATLLLDNGVAVFVDDGSFEQRQKIALAEFAKRFVETLTVVG